MHRSAPASRSALLSSFTWLQVVTKALLPIMSSDAPTLSTDVIQDGTGAADVAPDGATAGVSPADVLSGIGSPVNLPARTVILPGEADSPPTLAEAPTAPFVTGPPGVATAPFVTAPPGSAPASLQEFA